MYTDETNHHRLVHDHAIPLIPIGLRCACDTSAVRLRHAAAFRSVQDLTVQSAGSQYQARSWHVGENYNYICYAHFVVMRAAVLKFQTRQG